MFDLIHNKKIVGTYETYNDALLALQDKSPFSWDYSFKYGGWKILDQNTIHKHEDNYSCDGSCYRTDLVVRRLNLGGGSGIYLCHFCWNNEMEWRKERNRDLELSCRFTILEW